MNIPKLIILEKIYWAHEFWIFFQQSYKTIKNLNLYLNKIFGKVFDSSYEWIVWKDKEREKKMQTKI